MVFINRSLVCILYDLSRSLIFYSEKKRLIYFPYSRSSLTVFLLRAVHCLMFMTVWLKGHGSDIAYLCGYNNFGTSLHEVSSSFRIGFLVLWTTPKDAIITRLEMRFWTIESKHLCQRWYLFIYLFWIWNLGLSIIIVNKTENTFYHFSWSKVITFIYLFVLLLLHPIK